MICCCHRTKCTKFPPLDYCLHSGDEGNVNINVPDRPHQLDELLKKLTECIVFCLDGLGFIWPSHSLQLKGIIVLFHSTIDWAKLFWIVPAFTEAKATQLVDQQ